MPQPSSDTALQNINLKKTIYKSKMNFLIKVLYKSLSFHGYC